MAHPPSYQDATRRLDWLELVAPHLPVAQYARLCVVSRRFNRHLAPRLWNDPLSVAYMLNRHHDPEWLHGFLEHTVRVLRPETLALVTCLDLRKYAVATADFPLLWSDNKSFSRALGALPDTFPRLRCILLDGHAGLNPEALAPAELLSPHSEELPLLLSVPQCQTEVSASFFRSPYLKSLVFLDVSGLPRLLQVSLSQGALSPAQLPNLRIIKGAGQEVDNSTAGLLFKTFKQRLWSVDLSQNKLTDTILDELLAFSFPAQDLSTGDPAVEGRLSHCREGSVSFGQFCSVSESEWSTSFSHPHRFFVDAPSYNAHEQKGGSQPAPRSRLSGRSKILVDTEDALKTVFSGRLGDQSPSLHLIHDLDICQAHQGITHLYLNGNNVSTAGLARMIRSSTGQLQHLECDTMHFTVPREAPSSWLSKARLSGIVGAAHVFRPVHSANLQVLRIHHSLVTQLLSLHLHDLSPMANLWVAETHLLPRAELAYPEAFVPDMNPRLQSLVLTRIPRYSTGPLIDKLINFLKLAAIQERAIQDVSAANRCGPATVLGLRHIRLEFEPDHRKALEDGFDAELALDAAAVMDDSSKEFSFFGDSNWSSSPITTTTSRPSSSITATTTSPAAEKQARRHNPPDSTTETAATQSARPELSPHQSAQAAVEQQQPETALDSTHVSHTWTWNAQTFTRPIWTGFRTLDVSSANTTPTLIVRHASGDGNSSNSSDSQSPAAIPSPGRTPTPTPAVREYTRLLRAHPGLHRNPVPASPCHVAAGVPAGEFIFSAAWEAILVPPHPPTSSSSSSPPPPSSPSRSSSAVAPPAPTRAELQDMRDVVAALKEYRAGTRRAYERWKEGAGRKESREGKGKDKEEGEPHFHFHWLGRLEVSVVGG